MELLEKYQKALEIISDKNNFKTFSHAKNIYNHVVPAKDPSAVKWCSAGVLMKFGADSENEYKFIDQAAIKLGYKSAVILNDNADHETVLKMFNLAINEIVLATKK